MARVQQELAIAARIENADEVEIEEFYDASGEGSAGLKTNGEAVLLGASGAGRKVTRRIVRFKGWNGAVGADSTTTREGPSESSKAPASATK